VPALGGERRKGVALAERGGDSSPIPLRRRRKALPSPRCPKWALNAERENRSINAGTEGRGGKNRMKGGPPSSYRHHMALTSLEEERIEKPTTLLRREGRPT